MGQCSFSSMLYNWASFFKEVVEPSTLRGESTRSQQEENTGYSSVHADSPQRARWSGLQSLYTARLG